LRLGVDKRGALFADMEVQHGEVTKVERLIQPRIEAEMAFVLDRDLDKPDATTCELAQAVAFVAPALEIVDSRITEWKIGIFDTVRANIYFEFESEEGFAEDKYVGRKLQIGKGS
jgi:2-keto-4-pentenoate hydratase